MSVHAGSILHLAGHSVLDRVQSAGLGDVRLPIDTVREVGNREVVDKIPQEPDFNFSLESLDVSTELMAWLTGAYGSAGTGSAVAPGVGDPDGTEYNWLDCVFVNIPSPWKDPSTEPTGTIDAGHLIPGYYATQLTYRFGVTDNATQQVQLSGGSFYYADDAAPVEQKETGDNSTVAFVTDDDAVHYREGGSEGSTFRTIFGVLIDGELQVLDLDYTESGGGANPGSPATVTFAEAPATNADIRFCYFTSAEKSFPQAVHASTVTKPGAVRGRNIKVYLDDARVSGVQSMELAATVDATVDRELGNIEIIGRTINGTDTNGTVTTRAKDKDAFFSLLSTITGVNDDEVYGWFNDNTVELKIKIENPKNPGQIIKTLRVDDAKFQPPGTPARVNAPTDFAFGWESVNGTFVEVKGNDA